ncbi:MAG TPA: hypothetical protein VHY36_13380 [Steroidobacteraceae bacterium]|nr:hypothetical protein [Steroidobacteraceae bacterium]
MSTPTCVTFPRLRSLAVGAFALCGNHPYVVLAVFLIDRLAAIAIAWIETSATRRRSSDQPQRRGTA